MICEVPAGGKRISNTIFAACEEAVKNLHNRFFTSEIHEMHEPVSRHTESISLQEC